MLAYDEVQGNTTMFLSPSKLHFNQNPTDFTFCDIPNRKTHRNRDENEPPFGFSPPPLWSENVRTNRTSQSHPMTVMAQGRKELMEMMPESYQELSLKDIVVQHSDRSEWSSVLEESVDRKPGNKKESRKGLISRSVSLDTGIFFLKRFVPSSFGSKKHMVSRSRSTEHRVSNGSCTHNRHAKEGMLKADRCLFTSKPTRNQKQKGCIFF